MFNLYFKILDPFQVLVAANKAWQTSENGAKKTKTVFSEVLYSLSISGNVCEFHVCTYLSPCQHTCTANTHVHHCCGTYRLPWQLSEYYHGIDYQCNYLRITTVQLPLPLQISTRALNYHCNYISTITITIINYRFVPRCGQSYYTLTQFYF